MALAGKVAYHYTQCQLDRDRKTGAFDLREKKDPKKKMSTKKRSCILHIGTAKTGTTALQFGLADYDDGDTAYAKLPTAPDNPNHSEPLVLAGFGEDGIKKRLSDFSRWQAASDKLRWPNSIPLKMMQRDGKPPNPRPHLQALSECIANTPHDRMIFSGEGLFSNPGCAEGLIATLKQSFERIEGVCYLRSNPGAFLSRFQQRLTASDPLLFFSGALREDLDLLIYNDAKFLKAWKTALSGETLITPIYDPVTMKSGDVVDDFCDHLNLDPSRASRVRTNVSFSAQATAVLTALSFYGNAPADNPHFERNKRFLNVLMYQFGSGKLTLSDAFADRLEEANQEALDWVDQQCGRAFTRDRSRGDYVIDHHQDLLRICKDALPALTDFLRRASGLKLGWRVRDPARFAKILCQKLCEPNPFPNADYPKVFHPSNI